MLPRDVFMMRVTISITSILVVKSRREGSSFPTLKYQDIIEHSASKVAKILPLGFTSPEGSTVKLWLSTLLYEYFEDLGLFHRLMASGI